MTSPLARIRTPLATLALVALLPALYPGAALAQGPGKSPIDQLMHDGLPKDQATRQYRPANPELPARAPHLVTGDGQIGTVPPHEGPNAGADVLVENAWDFNDPDSIPGFASVPFPARKP